MKIAKNYILFLAAFTMLFTACKEEEVVDNTLRVAFKEFNGTIASAEDALVVELVSSRAADQDLALTIGVSGACNAVLADYVFTDEQGNTLELAGDVALNLTIPAGASSTFFTVATATNGFPVATEELDFALVAVENATLNNSHLLFEAVVGTGSGFFSNSYSNDFENCSNQSVPADFTLFNTGTKDDRSFYCRATNDETALTVSAFGGETGTVDAWLVTKKKFDFSGATKAVFTMDVISSFEGAGKLELLWSSDYCGSGSPAGVDWINLSALEAKLPVAGSDVLTTISANNPAIVGQSGYLAFRLSGATSISSVGYSIDNFTSKEPASGDGGNGGNGNVGSKFSTDFEGCTEDFATPENFIEEFLTAKEDRGWGCRSFGLDDSRAVQASAFGGAEGEDNSWLIIDQSFDFTSLTAVNFQMQMYSNFGGVGQVIAQYSTDYSGSGSPSAATWTALSAINDAMPAAGSQTWTPINEDITALGGKTVYIAFQFTGANNTASSSWAIDNLAINDAEAFSGDGGGNGGGGNGSAITQFDTDFEGCTENFATPAGFIEEFLTAKEDRGWGCRAFGLDDSRAVQASAFGGAEGEDHSWLIFENQFDFTAETTVNVLFSMYSNFSGPGQVIMKYSTDYSGSGKPDAATWTAISSVNGAMPEAGSQTWTEINQNVAELGGKTVFLAFEFVGANNSASSSWAIDNLAINNPGAF